MSLGDLARGGPVVDVGALLGAPACEYIASIITGGALVSLFRTRDAGAFGVQVTLNGDVAKEYVRTEEELCDWLRRVDQAVTEAPPAAPSVKRPRRTP